MPTPTGIPGITQLSPNTYRIVIQVTLTDPITKVRRRKWLRTQVSYSPTIPYDQQLELAAAERDALRNSAPELLLFSPQALLDNLPPPDQITVGQLTALWCDIALASKSADYRKTIDSLLRLHVLPTLGHKRIAALSRLELSAWEAALSRKRQHNSSGKLLSPRSVRHCHITLATIFKWGVINELIPRSPMDAIRPPRVRRHVPRFLDDEQAVCLLRQIAQEPNMEFRAAVLLALTAGLRLGEVCALTWQDIDWKHAAIHITKSLRQTSESGPVTDAPKTDDGIRTIAASAQMLTLLHETYLDQAERAGILGDRWKDSNLIVCNYDGSSLNKDTPSRWWKRFADKNGYQGVTFHNLRTSHVTILLANNMDAVAVASRLGHADATTTLHYYAMIVSRRDRDSAAVMDTLIHTSLPDTAPFALEDTIPPDPEEMHRLLHSAADPSAL